MNTTEANLPTSGIHVLSGGEVDRVNGGAVSDIINGVATVLAWFWTTSSLLRATPVPAWPPAAGSTDQRAAPSFTGTA